MNHEVEHPLKVDHFEGLMSEMKLFDHKDDPQRCDDHFDHHFEGLITTMVIDHIIKAENHREVENHSCGLGLDLTGSCANHCLPISELHL